MNKSFDSKRTYVWESDNNFYNFKNLNDFNRNYYISEIKKFFNKYLYDGAVSLSTDDLINLFGLSEKELFVLRSSHFLINPNVDLFFQYLPYLLRNLYHSTNNVNFESQGIIRGNIDWNGTIKNRYSTGNVDHSIFICSNPLKNYDLIENKILKFLLKQVIFMFEVYLDFIKTPNEHINLDYLSEDSVSWYAKAEVKYQLSKYSIKNVYFDKIGNLDFVSLIDINKLRSSRNPLYHNLGEVFELYEKLFINEDDECLIDLIQNQLIIASNNDKLYEIYVLFNIISYLEEICVENTFKIGLFYKNNNKPISARLSDNSIIKIYYQNSKPFQDNSYYRKLTENNEFNFKTSIRIPDIIIEIIKEGISYFRIIEVKNSSEPKTMNKSFYKVLGYYKDFESVNFTKNIPIIVVNWNGSSIDKKQKEKIFEQDVIFFNKEEFSENIEKLISL